MTDWFTRTCHWVTWTVLLLQQLPFRSLPHNHTHIEYPVLICHVARLKAFPASDGLYQNIYTGLGTDKGTIVMSQLISSILLLLSTPTHSVLYFVTNSTTSLLAAIQLFLLVSNTKAHHCMDIPYTHSYILITYFSTRFVLILHSHIFVDKVIISNDFPNKVLC
jgi:hypothetical protein